MTKQLHPVIAALSPEAQALYVKQLLEIDWWSPEGVDPHASAADAKLLRDMVIAGLTADEGAAE
jgi:hypothetical protein